MSSGDILFILVFIVLPTAVLVSAAWALVFIRQRPERAAHRYESRQAELSPYPELADDEDDTIIFATGSSGEESIPDAVEDEPVAEEPEPASEPEPEPVRPQYESQVPQTTEDLSSLDVPLEGPEPEPEFVPEPEPVEEEPELVNSDTSDLPDLESAPDNADVEEDILVEDRPGTGAIDRRRKQSVKLVPGESDSARNRVRNPLRQVPQLSRTNRRRDDTPAPDQG